MCYEDYRIDHNKTKKIGHLLMIKRKVRQNDIVYTYRNDNFSFKSKIFRRISHLYLLA